MAIALLSHEVSDITLGKPSLPWLSALISVRAALLALKCQEDVPEISVWDCAPGAHQLSKIATDPHLSPDQSACRCIGKVCMQKIICYLASDRNLLDIRAALDAPITVLFDEKSTCVQHIDRDASLHEALRMICGGAQNLVVQMKYPLNRYGNILRGNGLYNQNSVTKALVSNRHNGHEYCWLTHEDVLRFLLGSICVFSAISMLSIKQLGIIKTNVLMAGMDDDAISALDKIKTACASATAVAVVEKIYDRSESYSMVGEISCSTFQMCNETAVVALSALSVGDFLACIQDWRSSPDMLIMDSISAKLSKIKATESARDDDDERRRLRVSQMLHDLEMWDLSSDDEIGGLESPTGPHDLLRKQHSMHFHSNTRFGRSHNSPIHCRPTSSLIAVLMQALAHRKHYVWVTDEDSTLVGMVTFTDILILISNHLNSAC